MEIGSAHAARRMGVSERRVQEMARSRRLPARRVGRTWLIEDDALHAVRRRSRPMSERMGQAFVEVLSDPMVNARALGIAPSEVSRLRRHLAVLLDDDDPGSLLDSWLASEPAPMRCAADPADLPLIARDRRLVPSGISDRRIGLSVVDEVEGWVEVDDLSSLMGDYLLVGEGDVNVRLHVGPQRAPVSFGRLLVDLSRHAGARERDAVRRLLHDVVGPGRGR